MHHTETVTKTTLKYRISYSQHMHQWSDSLKNSIERDGAAVIVTVIAVDGSAPREVGATMIVSDGGTSGTIGGGNLEHTCISEARKLLTDSAGSLACTRQRQRISLGPSLGQCCGGRVELLYESVSTATDWFQMMTASQETETDRSLCRCLDNSTALVVNLAEFSAHTTARFTLPTMTSKESLFFAGIVKSDDGTRWFCEPLEVNRPQVWIYGAGHVGQSVVSQLELLPCNITLLDHREEWLSLQSESGCTQVLTDTPEADAVSASINTAHVIMTHSHALDFEICHAILKRDDFSWLGLIGSKTKRQTFANRLKQRGISDESIRRLQCPIGTLQLDSCLPSVIALNLAAELACHWQLTGKLR